MQLYRPLHSSTVSSWQPQKSLCPFNFTETTHSSLQGTEFQGIGS